MPRVRTKIYHRAQNFESKRKNELAAHPAFQQLKYTKNHPKVVPSYPVTGNAGVNFVEAKETDYIKQDEDRPRPSDKHLAEYGNLMMQNRNPNYS